MNLYIDVVGSCNLACPSCPAGNSVNNNSKGSMPPELLEAIVKKAKKENASSIGLYNWTEPLIHPKIGELISIVRSHGIFCSISSNLNLDKRLEDVVRANPEHLRVSVSGFSQEVYSTFHEGGDIGMVKANMLKLAELKKQYGTTTRVDIYYHRYLGNLDDEIRMKKFAEDLGFQFLASWALIMPLEKGVAIAENDESLISEKDRLIISKLALPFLDAINISKNYRDTPCALKDDQIVLDCQGNVILCCGVFDQGKYNLGSYLDMSLDVIQQKKYSDADCVEMCDSCTKHGLHVYGQFPDKLPEFNQLASVNILKNYGARLGVNIN